MGIRSSRNALGMVKVTAMALTFASGPFALYNPNIMSYLYSILADKPLGLWMLDDSAPFQDYSGYDAAGVMDTGSPTTAAALVAGADYSAVFSNSVDAKFDSAVYKQGYEHLPFSLEVSFRVIDETGTTSEQKVLSSSANYDGITVDGTIIKFSTKYLTAGECAVEYDIQTKRNVHVVGVHTRDKNQLFVDGTLVGETTITEAQKIDSFVAGDGKLWLGTSASTQKIAVNGISIYATGLSDDIVKNHFNAARRTTLNETVAPTFGGIRYPMSLNMADTFVRALWQDDSDWKIGTLNNVSLVDTQIVPQLVAGVSVAGNWQVALPLDQSGLTDVYGLSMDWTGVNVIVEASLDGTTWETAVKGQKMALIPDGFDPTNKDLFIRASFAGGITDDPGFLDNLFVVGFTTGIQPNIGGRDTTFTDPASPMNDYQPIELRDDWGVKLDGGSVEISADSSPDPLAVYTMNIWLKKLTSTSPTISLTGTTDYKNGVAGGTMNEGEWVMWTMTKATELTGDITISGDVQIGQIEFFDHQLSAQEVADLYSAYTGVVAVQANESDSVTVTNPNPSTRIYDYTWAITAAG